jgi:hypothetical protein
MEVISMNLYSKLESDSIKKNNEKGLISVAEKQATELIKRNLKIKEQNELKESQIFRITLTQLLNGVKIPKYRSSAICYLKITSKGLAIKFHSHPQDTYYYLTPTIRECVELVNANSIGKFYNKQIKVNKKVYAK